MKKLIVAVLLMTFVQVSYGWMIYGAGSFSCGKWLENRREQGGWAQVANTTWVAGYVTAAQDHGGLNLKTSDTNAMEAFVDKHCRENPLDSILDASRALVRALQQ